MKKIDGTTSSKPPVPTIKEDTRFIEFAKILVVCSFGGLVFFILGMKPAIAIGIAFFFLVLGLSMLNYLNYGKFRPFISRASITEYQEDNNI